MQSWDSGNLNPGQTYSYAFTMAGNYPYVCSYHQGIEGGDLRPVTVAAVRSQYPAASGDQLAGKPVPA